MGAYRQGNQDEYRAETFSPTPDPHPDFWGGVGEGWRLKKLSMGNDLISNAYVMKPP